MTCAVSFDSFEYDLGQCGQKWAFLAADMDGWPVVGLAAGGAEEEEEGRVVCGGRGRALVEATELKGRWAVASANDMTAAILGQSAGIVSGTAC